jgi:hypothetical protein
MRIEGRDHQLRVTRPLLGDLGIAAEDPLFGLPHHLLDSRHEGLAGPLHRADQDAHAVAQQTAVGWTAKQIHEAILTTFGLSPKAYGLNQLRYDLRKLKGHGLLQRDGGHYAYQLTAKGVQVALLFLFFHQRLCGPLANSRFHHQPAPTANSKLRTTTPAKPSRQSSICWPPRSVVDRMLKYSCLRSSFQESSRLFSQGH